MRKNQYWILIAIITLLLAGGCKAERKNRSDSDKEPKESTTNEALSPSTESSAKPQEPPPNTGTGLPHFAAAEDPLGGNAGSASPWGHEVEKEFMDACVEGNMGVSKSTHFRYCECSKRYLQRNYTLAEVVKMGNEYEVSDARIPKGMRESGEHCMKETFSRRDLLDQFRVGCASELPSMFSSTRGDTYCRCTADRVGDRFSQAELVEMSVNTEFKGEELPKEVETIALLCMKAVFPKNDLLAIVKDGCVVEIKDQFSATVVDSFCQCGIDYLGERHSAAELMRLFISIEEEGPEGPGSKTMEAAGDACAEKMAP